MRNSTKRQATYIINVPMQITFAADNDLTVEEFELKAKAEIQKRLCSGYFDVLTDDVKIVKKLTHRTKEEIRAEQIAWDNFFRSIRGLRI